MNGASISAAATAVATAIACGKSENEINLLSCFFTQVGDSLATIVAGNICCCGTNSDEESDISDVIHS